MFKYQNANDLQSDCQKSFSDHLKEGLSRHPDMKPSHLCIRSASLQDFGRLSSYGAKLGQVGTTYKGTLEIKWVHLNEPLLYGKHKLNWLEITSPKRDIHHKTGPQMLVFAKDNFAMKIKEKASTEDLFEYGYQGKSADDIVQQRFSL